MPTPCLVVPRRQALLWEQIQSVALKGETHSGSFPMENGKSEEVKSGEEQVKEGALIATQGLGNVCV